MNSQKFTAEYTKKYSRSSEHNVVTGLDESGNLLNDSKHLPSLEYVGLLSPGSVFFSRPGCSEKNLFYYSHGTCIFKLYISLLSLYIFTS